MWKHEKCKDLAKKVRPPLQNMHAKRRSASRKEWKGKAASPARLARHWGGKTLRWQASKEPSKG